MLTDFAEIWYTKVFECAEYENVAKIWQNIPNNFWPKNLCFLGAEPPKSDRKLKLSDFDEIWYPGVFEGADFRNCIHFYVESFCRWMSVVGFWGPLSISLKVVEIEI